MSADLTGHEGCGTTKDADGGRLLAKTDLHARGWTETAIRRFLGQPNSTKPNPHYKCAAPMCLYDPKRVAAAETTAEFVEWRARSDVRRQRARDIAAKKAKELRAMVSRWDPGIPNLPLDELRRRAIESYNTRARDREWERKCDLSWDPERPWSPAEEGSDPDFLARIMVNYLRHNRTSYDSMLDRVAGRVGVREARAMTRERVYAAIAAQYPELKAEVRSQRRARKEREDLRDLRGW